MKKNITINFFGTLYAIDEDAYELLNRYLSDIKKYFSRKEGGEEIADDIEHRVAELMLELKTNGREPIDIELVKEIIGRIGNPEDLDDTVSQSESATTAEGHRGREWFTEQVTKKRLFCNPNDKMLCGVLSGIACYFGVEPVWVRLAVVALAILPIPFFSVSLLTILVIYFIMALIIPEAKTPEERLQMRGKPVNMETLNEEIVSGANPSDKQSSSNRGVLIVLIKAVLIIMLAPFLLLGFVFLLLVLFGAGFLSMIIPNSDLVRHSIGMGSDDLMILDHISGSGFTWTSGIALFIAVAILVYLIIHVIMRILGRGRSLGRTLWIYLAVFIVSLIVGISSLVGFGMDMDATSREIRVEYNAIRDKQSNQEAFDWLTDRGWEIVAHDHTFNYIKNGEHYSGDWNKKYIDGFSEHPNMLYTVERTVRITPGVYDLEAVVRTDGEGPEVYAFDSEGNRFSVSFPVCSNSGGELWKETDLIVKAGGTLTDEMARINRANNGRGYGWSRVCIENICITDSIIRYGVTNRNEAIGLWNGHWFSATEFKLKKAE